MSCVNPLVDDINHLEDEIAKVATQMSKLEEKYQKLSDAILQKKRQISLKTNYEKE